VGDCETTSDILGPFYRPNSPVRRNLVDKGEKGTLVELSGKIKHLDCVSPYKMLRLNYGIVMQTMFMTMKLMLLSLEVLLFQTTMAIMLFKPSHQCLMI
jgi:hypothetical protein